MAIPGANSGTTVTSVPKASTWQPARVISIRQETPRVKTIRFAISNWPGHLAGQHADVRLEDPSEGISSGLLQKRDVRFYWLAAGVALCR
jgi:ferredoxin-NADP reductase